MTLARATNGTRDEIDLDHSSPPDVDDDGGSADDELSMTRAGDGWAARRRSVRRRTSTALMGDTSQRRTPQAWRRASMGLTGARLAQRARPQARASVAPSLGRGGCARPCSRAHGANRLPINAFRPLRFRAAPRTSQSLRARLRVPQTGCTGWGEAHASPETARFHHAARRRGGMAARGERLASRETGGQARKLRRKWRKR